MNAINVAWKGDEKYKNAYEDQTLNLVFTAINNEFYKDAKGTFAEKYNNIKKICNKDEVRNAIRVLRKNDLRAKLIMKRKTLLLCLIAMVLNKKHRR